MTGYNWPEIMAKKSDSELKQFFKDRYREPKEKIEVVIEELKKRNILEENDDAVLKFTQKPLNFYDDIENFKYVRPNQERAQWAIWLIFAVLILDIISIFFDFSQYNLLLSIQNGELVTEEVANANDQRQQILGIIYLLVYFVSGIVFIQWFRRAYYNLHFRVKRCDFSEGWAAGCWFVPIVNLFRPVAIMDELWKKTNKLIKEKDSHYIVKSGSFIMVSWWALWIISGFVGRYVARSAFKGETLEDLIGSSISSIVLSCLAIPLALVTIKMISDYSKMENRLNSLVRSQVEEQQLAS